MQFIWSEFMIRLEFDFWQQYMELILFNFRRNEQQ